MTAARAFLSTGVTSREPHGSCNLTTQQPDPLSLDVHRGIEVPIVNDPTLGTDPFPIREGQLLVDRPTVRTGLRGWEEGPALGMIGPIDVTLKGSIDEPMPEGLIRADRQCNIDLDRRDVRGIQA